MAAIKMPYLEKIGERGKFHVWIVDGSYIRTQIDEEFTNFGHHLSFPYIPENEFWLDREAENDERRFFIEHLLIEHRLMSKGRPYDEALVIADQAERKERRRAGDLKRLTGGGGTKKLPDGHDVHERLWNTLENGVSVWIDRKSVV
jgi:hypothetical protein